LLNAQSSKEEIELFQSILGKKKAAAQFYQLEIYFQSAVRLSIMEQIPFIGEFEQALALQATE
jgi:hypothetical protein